jgi:hypothetical protein
MIHDAQRKQRQSNNQQKNEEAFHANSLSCHSAPTDARLEYSNRATETKDAGKEHDHRDVNPVHRHEDAEQTHRHWPVPAPHRHAVRARETAKPRAMPPWAI